MGSWIRFKKFTFLSFSPPFFLFYFFFLLPATVQTGRTEFRPAHRLPVCTCVDVELILPLNLPGRRRGLYLFIDAETQREKERVEMVESVTRANRITLYFPPDEGRWVWYGGEDLRRREGGVGECSKEGGLLKRTNSWRRARNAQRNQQQQSLSPLPCTIYTNAGRNAPTGLCAYVCACVCVGRFFLDSHSTSLHHVLFFLSLFVRAVCVCVFLLRVRQRLETCALGALCTRRHRQSFYTHTHTQRKQTISYL